MVTAVLKRLLEITEKTFSPKPLLNITFLLETIIFLTKMVMFFYSTNNWQSPISTRLNDVHSANRSHRRIAIATRTRAKPHPLLTAMLNLQYINNPRFNTENGVFPHFFVRTPIYRNLNELSE